MAKVEVLQDGATLEGHKHKAGDIIPNFPDDLIRDWVPAGLCKVLVNNKNQSVIPKNAPKAKSETPAEPETEQQNQGE